MNMYPEEKKDRILNWQKHYEKLLVFVLIVSTLHLWSAKQIIMSWQIVTQSDYYAHGHYPSTSADFTTQYIDEF